MRRLIFLLAFTIVALPQNAPNDWPQFLGPGRDGVYRGAALLETWPERGPRVVWRKDVGAGFAGPVVSQGHVILFHRSNNREIAEAMDPATGATQWKYDYPTAYRDDFGFDEGPRAAPVIADGIVYTFGAEGQLNALELASGKRLWGEDTRARFKVAKGFFGAAGSPIVDQGRVIANIGGAEAGIVAFDAKTGKVLWTSTSDEASYSSGVVATIGGRKTAVFLTRTNLLGLDPATGKVVFQKRWRALQAASVNAATPVIVNDPMGTLIFVSAEYGPGAGVFRVEGANLTPLWTSDEALTNHYATSIHRDGVLYGFHGRQEYGQSLRAVDLRTGKVRWSQERYFAGSLIMAGDRLLILRETGELVLAAASPASYQQLARAFILPGPVRPFPALADGRLYARNEKSLVAVDLRK
ncbi:MAG TPA: PQQ-binding-like beta-propeller repeat protein [Terriglobia bacterium]|nr:PQQ-binding-like beta-propeller repeat protein [Terriglobia bacterium]